MKKIQALGLTLSVVHSATEGVLDLAKLPPEKSVTVAPFAIKLLAGRKIAPLIFPISRGSGA